MCGNIWRILEMSAVVVIGSPLPQMSMTNNICDSQSDSAVAILQVGQCHALQLGPGGRRNYFFSWEILRLEAGGGRPYYSLPLIFEKSRVDAAPLNIKESSLYVGQSRDWCKCCYEDVRFLSRKDQWSFHKFYISRSPTNGIYLLLCCSMEILSPTYVS